MKSASCRFCGRSLTHTFVDLGMSPLCESYISVEQLNEMERFYPLHVYVCDNCFLVQLLEYVSPDRIFSDYAYFSSYSDSWLKHAQNYAEMAIARFELDSKSQVVEIASNDGYLLQYFVQRGIPVLGVEPAATLQQWQSARGFLLSSNSSANKPRASLYRRENKPISCSATTSWRTCLT